jgi:hypothetical protein
MRNVLAEIVRLEEAHVEPIHGVRIGRLVAVKDTGHLLVDYQGNPFDLLPARSTVCIAPGDEKRELLLMFEKTDPQLPIIVGFVQDQPVVTALSKEVVLDKKKVKDIIVDGERIIFDAKKEVVLRCGQGSVTIRADGKIVIKGTDLLSRSKGINKIKGATVRIN